jgi:hypothetical protein
LIHENDFYRRGGPGWGRSSRKATATGGAPRQPPFDLDTPPPPRFRPAEVREAIFRKYEDLVARAAASLRVVTSDDIVAQAAASGSTTADGKPGSR